MLCLGFTLAAGMPGCTETDLEAIRGVIADGKANLEKSNAYIEAKKADLAKLVEDIATLPDGPQKVAKEAEKAKVEKDLAEAEKQKATVLEYVTKAETALAGAKNEWDLIQGIVDGAIPYLPPMAALIASTIVGFGKAAQAEAATSEIVTSIEAGKDTLDSTARAAFGEAVDKKQSPQVKVAVATAKAGAK